LAAACIGANADPLSILLEDYSKAAAQGKTTHFMDIDNDSLLLKKDDGFYTSGLRYMRQHTLVNANASNTFGWRLGQEQYTASDINLPPSSVGPPDHPYAGWLYGGMFRQTHRADGTHRKIGVDIGCLGPCAGGEWTQNTLHRLLNQPLPQAWSKQVKNELGVVLYADVAPVRWTVNPVFDVTPNLHGRFGNIFSDAGAGITLRAGQLNLLPHQSTFHGYLRIDSRIVGYNATLQGGYFSKGNPHTVKPKRWTGEAEAGLAWNSAAYGIRLSVVRRSNEIQDLSNARGAQNFARLQFSYTP
jgi:lipid A 3-O-deacylase